MDCKIEMKSYFVAVKIVESKNLKTPILISVLTPQKKPPKSGPRNNSKIEFIEHFKNVCRGLRRSN